MLGYYIGAFLIIHPIMFGIGYWKGKEKGKRIAIKNHERAHLKRMVNILEPNK